MRRSHIKLFFLGIFFFLIAHTAFCNGLESIEFFTGYLYGDLNKQDDYQAIPLMASFGFDLKPLVEKIGINTQGILQFQVEPFISPIFGPDANVELGVTFLFKYAFPLTERFMPYVKFGAGPAYMTLHTREQSTQFNFVDSAGMGFNWFLKEDVALACEFRYRHMSNARIKSPNKGINTYLALVGISFFLE